FVFVRLRHCYVSPPSICVRLDRGARYPVEPFALAASSIQRSAERCVPRENTVPRAAHTGLCADACWRIAKARTEKPVEVGNIGKASLQRDVANTEMDQVLRCKERERVFQP